MTLLLLLGGRRLVMAWVVPYAGYGAQPRVGVMVCRLASRLVLVKKHGRETRMVMVRLVLQLVDIGRSPARR